MLRRGPAVPRRGLDDLYPGLKDGAMSRGDVDDRALVAGDTGTALTSRRAGIARCALAMLWPVEHSLLRSPTARIWTRVNAPD